jgi:hypothetical protein
LCLQEEKDLSSEEEVKHKERVLILHALFLINHMIDPDENVCEIADSLLGQLRNKFRQVFIVWLSGWCIQNNTNRHEEMLEVWTLIPILVLMESGTLEQAMP